MILTLSNDEITKIKEHFKIETGILDPWSEEIASDSVLFKQFEERWSSIDTESWDHVTVIIVTKISNIKDADIENYSPTSIDEELKKFPFNKFAEEWIIGWGTSYHFVCEIPGCNGVFQYIEASSDTKDKYW